jgi:hypothetical protein
VHLAAVAAEQVHQVGRLGGAPLRARARRTRTARACARAAPCARPWPRRWRGTSRGAAPRGRARRARRSAGS